MCGYSWETLEGVHPVLMGNEVTQPPGIPAQLVTPSSSSAFIPKTARVMLVTVSVWEHLVAFPESRFRCVATFAGSERRLLPACWPSAVCTLGSIGKVLTAAWCCPSRFSVRQAGVRPTFWNFVKASQVMVIGRQGQEQTTRRRQCFLNGSDLGALPPSP